MLVAHVEQDGVWYIDRGMYALIETLVKLIEAQGGVSNATAMLPPSHEMRGRQRACVLNLAKK